MLRIQVLIALMAFCIIARGESVNISFEDAAVKVLCVNNWDNDGDGELSIEEAASITTLGIVFREQNSIKSFDELKFFTGLTSISDYAFYKSGITKVTFPGSIAAIGEYAFYGTSLSGDLIVPGNVKMIGAYAFYSCQKMERVFLEEGVESVGFRAFSGPITYLSLPVSLSFMGSIAIDPYVNADPGSGMFVPKGNLYVQVPSMVPAEIDDFTYYRLFGAGHLIVPFGTVDAYKAVPGWSHFGEYLQAGDVNGDGALNVKDVVSLSAHIMGNRPSPFDERLADVNGDGKVNVKDVTLVCNWIMRRNGNQN